MEFILQMACNKVFEFLAAVRGYHYYRRFWIPQKVQILECFFETHNLFDNFAIKVCKVGNENTVGHFLEKYHAFRNFSWIGEPLSVFNFN